MCNQIFQREIGGDMLKLDNRLPKSLLVKFYFHQRLLLMQIHYLFHKLSEEHLLFLWMVISDCSMDFVLFELHY